MKLTIENETFDLPSLAPGSHTPGGQMSMKERIKKWAFNLALIAELLVLFALLLGAFALWPAIAYVNCGTIAALVVLGLEVLTIMVARGLR